MMKKYFKIFVAAGYHNPGPKLQSVFRAFYLFFAKTKFKFDIGNDDNENDIDDESNSDSE